MSDSDQNKIGEHTDEIIDVDNTEYKIPAIGHMSAGLPDGSDLANISDIDDGDDNEDGIFAPPPVKKKSTGMLTGLATVLAVLGVSGFVYTTQPELVARLTSEYLGSAVVVNQPVEPVVEAENSATPDVNIVPAPIQNVVEGSAELPAVGEGGMTAPEPVPVQVSPTVMATQESAPTGPSDSALKVEGEAVVQPSANVAATTAPVEPVAAVSEVVPEAAVAIPKQEGADSVVAQPATEASGEVKDSQEVKFVAIDLSDKKAAPPTDVKVSEPKVVGEVPKQEAQSKKVEVSKVESKTDQSAVVKAPDDKALQPSKDGTQVAQDKSVSKKSVKESNGKSEKKSSSKVDHESINEALSDKPVTDRNGNVVDLSEDINKTVFFDSPEGKMLKGMPAPSMNPSKGNGESIIIVSPANKPSGASKKSDSKLAKNVMTVTSTDLEPKIVAATRAMKLERYEAAQQMYEELYKLNQRDGRILMGRAIMLQKTGRTVEAVTAYEELLKVDPQNADAVVNYAGLIRKTNPAIALNKLLDLKAKFPENVAVLAQLGISFADSGNFEDAYRNLSQAAALDPQNPQHYYNMGVIAEHSRDSLKAISNYEKSLEVDAIYGSGRLISREKIYDRLAILRGN